MKLHSLFRSIFSMFSQNAMAKKMVWATAISTNGQRSIIFRYMKTLPSETMKKEKAVRIIVLWTYDSLSGMPDAQDNEDMISLENYLESAVVASGIALLALVSTGENSKEWIYYARSEDEFMEALNTALHAKKKYPIEIHIAPDPSWSSYTTFVAGVVDDSGN